jgi:hypothetical protein
MSPAVGSEPATEEKIMWSRQWRGDARLRGAARMEKENEAGVVA